MTLVLSALSVLSSTSVEPREIESRSDARTPTGCELRSPPTSDSDADADEPSDAPRLRDIEPP